MRALKLLAGMGVLTASLVWSSTSTVSAGPDCSQPTVQALVSAEAAVSRPVIASPAEYGLSNVYSLIEQATKPLFTYAEAGPQYAGAFEALAPAGSPPPPRAVSAYPSEDIPDSTDADWGGTSHTEVTPISASAASSGARELGAGGATSRNSRSWATSVVECDTVTVIAGWHASDVVLAPGVTAEELGEVLTLVVGPTGSSAKTDVTVVGVNGAEVVPVSGRPADPFTDPMREGGGPRVEIGEPRTTAEDTTASASGGGFNFLLTDPATGQGAGYRVGSINARIEILGPLVGAPPEVTPPVTAVVLPDVVAPSPPSPAVAVVGAPPPPSPVAVEAARATFTDTAISTIRVRTRSWTWLAVLIASALMVAGMVVTQRSWRTRFPTADWLVRHGHRISRRFSAVYLQW